MFARHRRYLLALLLVLPLLGVLGWSPTPSARAAEGPSVEGNYVALAKPVRVLSGAKVNVCGSVPFQPTGVTGVPREGTTGVVLAVTANGTGTYGTTAQVATYSPTGWLSYWVDALELDEKQTALIENTVTLPVDETRTSGQLSLRESGCNSSFTGWVDVVGYYTKNAVGGGFVPVRHTTLFDTRTAGNVAVPAGGTVTKTVTGGIVPAGAQSVYMDLVVTNPTTAGSVIVVPAGTDTSAQPMMRVTAGGGAISNLVVAKVGTNGQVTFKNNTTAAVHLLARAEGYTTNSAGTGEGWHPGRIEGDTYSIGANKKVTIAVADTIFVPKTGVGAVFASLDIYGTTGSGYLRINPSDQVAGTTSLLNFAGAADIYHHRTSGAILNPGADGKIVVENVSAKAISLELYTHAYFTAPTDYTSEGGATELSVAHTSAGPCYGFLEPTAHDVRVGCSSGYEGNDSVFTRISPAGQKFRGPVSVVAKPNGRVVVSALHAPDGELWFWEFAHTTGAPSPTVVRSYRYMKNPMVSATLPNGSPVGFVQDVENRLWAVDLSATAPEQPQWKMLDLPAAAPTSALTATSTPAGIRIAGTTAGGDVLTGLYTSLTSTSVGWQSTGATGATGRVAVGVSQSGAARVAVFHGDNTVWSASLSATGQPVDGWHQVNTSYNGSPVPLAGSPTMTYDLSTGENIVYFRSDAVGTGSLYKVRENAPNSGVFDRDVLPNAVDTMGIASDVTAWDYRTDTQPYYRRWSIAYFDTAYGKRVQTSLVE